MKGRGCTLLPCFAHFAHFAGHGTRYSFISPRFDYGGFLVNMSSRGAENTETNGRSNRRNRGGGGGNTGGATSVQPVTSSAAANSSSQTPVVSSMSDTSRKRHGTVSHILALILTFIALLSFLLILLFNVPLTAYPIETVWASEQRFWLITVSSVTAAAGTANYKESGFGVWGWCDWTNPPGSTNPPDQATCTEQAFWQIPGTTVPDPQVLALNLPG